MTTLLTDLMQHLQTLHSDHPGDDGRLMVAVSTRPHTMEHFEVSEFHHVGSSVVLYCQSAEAEQPAPAAEPTPVQKPPEPQAKRVRACVHNDYNDLC
jgi:hypothetical protein